MGFVESRYKQHTIASILRTKIESARNGKQGAIFFRKRAKQVFDDACALQADPKKDFEGWIDQRITLKIGPTKHQYHFDGFNAFLHALAWVVSSPFPEKEEMPMHKMRKKAIKDAEIQSIPDFLQDVEYSV